MQSTIVLLVTNLKTDRESKMQRPTSTARSSDEHWIVVPMESLDHPMCSPMLKERSQSAMRERLIHCIPLILILCFMVLWFYSRPVSLVIKNGVPEGNGTMPIMLDHPLVDFSMLKPVFTSLAPAPLNQNTQDANGSDNVEINR